MPPVDDIRFASFCHDWLIYFFIYFAFADAAADITPFAAAAYGCYAMRYYDGCRCLISLRDADFLSLRQMPPRRMLILLFSRRASLLIFADAERGADAFSIFFAIFFFWRFILLMMPLLCLLSQRLFIYIMPCLCFYAAVYAAYFH